MDELMKTQYANEDMEKIRRLANKKHREYKEKVWNEIKLMKSDEDCGAWNGKKLLRVILLSIFEHGFNEGKLYLKINESSIQKKVDAGCKLMNDWIKDR